MKSFIERVVPERLLSWRWHPAAIDPAVDYSQEPEPRWSSLNSGKRTVASC
jgi:hypothetical protein